MLRKLHRGQSGEIFENLSQSRYDSSDNFNTCQLLNNKVKSNKQKKKQIQSLFFCIMKYCIFVYIKAFFFLFFEILLNFFLINFICLRFIYGRSLPKKKKKSSSECKEQGTLDQQKKTVVKAICHSDREK